MSTSCGLKMFFHLLRKNDVPVPVFLNSYCSTQCSFTKTKVVKQMFKQKTDSEERKSGILSFFLKLTQI